MANLDVVKNAIAEGTKEMMRHTTIDKISVNDICEKVGVQRRNFYRYFRDKYEVVQWINFRDFTTVMTRYKEWTIWDYMDHIANTLYSDRDYYRNAFRDQSQNSLRAEIISYFRDVFRKDFRDCFEEERSFERYYLTIMNFSFDLFIDWLEEEPCRRPEEFVRYFKNFFYKPAQEICRQIESPREDGTVEPFLPEEPSKK